MSTAARFPQPECRSATTATTYWSGATCQDALTGGAGRDALGFEQGDSDVDDDGKTIDSITDFKGEDRIVFITWISRNAR